MLLSSGTYHAAVMENRSDFSGRVVVDVGAGSGILSMFAALVCKYLRNFEIKGFRTTLVLHCAFVFLISVHCLGWRQARVCCGSVRDG